MRRLRSERDLAEMLAESSAALFVFVGWSEYARHGRDMCELAEQRLNTTQSASAMSWWIADISSIDLPPNPALHKWLTDQEQRGGVKLFPNIAMGNGSVVWIRSGDILGFESSTRRLGFEELILRARGITAAS